MMWPLNRQVSRQVSRQASRQLLGIVLLSVGLCSQALAKDQFAVATAHPLATEAGQQILERGGNAFDAAIAISAVLAVVEPYGSGFGGGGFWLLYRSDKKSSVMIDGRETAPLAASADMYLDAEGKPIPGLSVNGVLAAGIPGMPAALAHVAERYASLDLAVLLQPALRIAEQGFSADKEFVRFAEMRHKVLAASSASARVFLQHNQAPKLGARIVQKDLAKTIRRIAEQGRRGFYAGPVAAEMVRAVRAEGGIWSMQDLATYTVLEREPITIQYHDLRITTVAPPSSGGIVLAQIFNILELFDVSALDATQRIHYQVEAMRRAYQDRALWLGDSDFIAIPDDLTMKSYAKELARDIKPRKASSSERLKRLKPAAKKGQDTTHFSVVDRRGNRVAATLSVNYPFGSGVIAGNTGVLLNNEMDDFAIAPGVPNLYGLVGGEANAIEPGKRMLSSMSPTFVEDDKRIAVLGTPGGSRIITMLMIAILEFAQGASALAIVSAPRYHHQYLPDTITFEGKAFSSRTRSALTKMGHRLELRKTPYGNMQAIVINKKSGTMQAASDPRGIGSAYVAP